MVNDEQVPQLTLATLPADELAKIFRFLTVDDINNVRFLSKTLHQTCEDERIWHSVCESRWGDFTDVRLWLPRAGKTDSPRPRGFSHAPQKFKELFFMLHLVEDMIGLWRVIGGGPHGSLISFTWTSDGIEGHEVRYTSFSDPDPELLGYNRVCPRRGLSVAVEWNEGGDDKSTLTLRSLAPFNGADNRLRRSPSGEAAAAVGYGTSPPMQSA